MRAIRAKDTKPELHIRRLLHAAGFRFRLHRKDLPGNPDIVLPKYRTAIFVHGCFWHGHECYLFKVPSTRREFWVEKIGANRRRDNAKTQALLDQSWRVLTIWECAVKGRKRQSDQELVKCISNWLSSPRTLGFLGYDQSQE
jgi:DNA mismatch endonuclease (patch repair protein)